MTARQQGETATEIDGKQHGATATQHDGTAWLVGEKCRATATVYDGTTAWRVGGATATECDGESSMGQQRHSMTARHGLWVENVSATATEQDAEVDGVALQPPQPHQPQQRIHGRDRRTCCGACITYTMVCCGGATVELVCPCRLRSSISLSSSKCIGGGGRGGELVGQREQARA
jgi:hypothetical protein